jgi:hypothetical protein
MVKEADIPERRKYMREYLKAQEPGKPQRPLTAKVRILKQSDIGKCPHVIFMPDHYREDGSCKCNDPDDKEMAEWGYVWSDKTKQWE